MTEFAYFEQAKASDASAYRWENNDFIWHFYMGGGQEVTLAEIGHLDEVINQYADLDGNEGAYRRLADQISDAARRDKLPYDFSETYDFSKEDAVSAIFFAISELGGTAYEISGKWDADFEASVLVENNKSRYTASQNEKE